MRSKWYPDRLTNFNNPLLQEAARTYDDAGNLLTKTEISSGEVTTYTYDYRNRVIRAEVKSSGGVLLSEVDYTYDVFDRLIARTVDSDGAGAQAAETSYTVYDGDHAWADFDDTGAVTARYLFGDFVGLLDSLVVE